MLQQTQVATVVPYFQRFIERWPAVAALAAAAEQDVLRAWQGLGYYSRARNLHKAAQAIVERFDSRIPDNLDDLLSLPGVGRYTAGAIASLAHEKRAPILDGNVIRVITRIDRIQDDPRLPAIREKLWARAEELLPKKCVGDFNSALMELGATICTPRNPRCLFCPVKDHCEAFAAGMQEQIPAPRKARPRPIEKRQTICIRHRDRWLIERRPDTGRWAGMWQFITLVAGRELQKRTSDAAGIAIQKLKPLATIHHDLTHRRYEIEAYTAIAKKNATTQSGIRAWVTLDELNQYPLTGPHSQIAALLSQTH
jgi:A/G-specific adenine glycosylase